MTEATAVSACGIGKPDLRYEQFPYDQVQQVLTQMGVPPKEPRSPENSTPTSFEQFVHDVFAPAYHGNVATASESGVEM